MTEDDERAVQVSELDHGDPDEPELGRWLAADADLIRTEAARRLALAVAVAAARLTGGAVLDELLVATGERLSDPDAVVAAVRTRGTR